MSKRIEVQVSDEVAQGYADRMMSFGEVGPGVCIEVLIRDRVRLLRVERAARAHLDAIRNPRPGGVVETTFALSAAIDETEAGDNDA